MKDKKNKELILFDEEMIGASPRIMRELMMRGYRVLAVSPSCGSIEVECFTSKDIFSNKEINTRAKIGERG